MRRTFVVALVAFPLLMGTLLVRAATPASRPVHQVKGSGTFWLEAGVPNGGNLIQHYSFNASLDQDGSAHGLIAGTIDWMTVPPAGGHPDPYGTGNPVLFEVTGLTVTGNVAHIDVRVIFAPDFPEEEGTDHYFDVVDIGAPPNSGDLVFFDGFGPLVTVAGNIIVR